MLSLSLVMAALMRRSSGSRLMAAMPPRRGREKASRRVFLMVPWGGGDDDEAVAGEVVDGEDVWTVSSFAELEEAGDGTAAAGAGGEGEFVDFFPVGFAAVGEDEEVVVGGGDE